jgi:WD40 repeat protein
MGYSLLDLDISHDSENLIYSTWSRAIYLFNLNKNKHYTFDLTDEVENFACFSIQFNSNSNEIIAATSKGIIYVYDLSSNQSSAVIPFPMFKIQDQRT